jgi:hypothetical protein
MTFDPGSISYRALFVDPRMFDSRAAWSAAGFSIVAPGKVTECMAASHPSAPGYLFKKYANDVPRKKQNENYEARIEGAAKLARFIEKKGLRHIVVPQKSLRELPRTFDKSSRLLVVERLDVLGPDESVLRYRDIADPVLRELLAVIAKFKGLDSNAKNIPFLRDGRIAFVDLENWERRKKHHLKNIGSYLPEEKLQFARSLLEKLR